MKKCLLLCLAALWAVTSASAHQVDPWTLLYDDNELYNDSTNTDGWDPQGDVPPSVTADYYLHTSQNGAYYPLTKVDGSNPVEYTGYMPVLDGNFKIYGIGYWTSGASGTERDKYIYGSAEQNGGLYKEQYKTLSHPGQSDMMIENGGIWYGVDIRFYPNGTASNSTPQVYLVGASKTALLSLEATGTPDTKTTGHVDFTIKPGGIVDSQDQTYKVTLTYTGYTSKATITRDTTITDGLTGTFLNVTDLQPGASNKMNLTVTANDVPVSSTVGATTAESRQTLTASATCYIVTPGPVYLIGDIDGVDWKPENAIEGQTYNARHPRATVDDGDQLLCWYDVPLKGTFRFSFISSNDSNWDVVNQSVRYNPVSVDSNTNPPTKYCYNLYENELSLEPFDGNWYDSTAATGSNENAWAPMIAKTNGQSTDTGEASRMYYSIFLNPYTKKAGIRWQETTTAITAILENPAPENNVVDVYNLQGSLLKHHVAPADATQGLPAGIYIVGNKKLAVH